MYLSQLRWVTLTWPLTSTSTCSLSRRYSFYHNHVFVVQSCDLAFVPLLKCDWVSVSVALKMFQSSPVVQVHPDVGYISRNIWILTDETSRPGRTNTGFVPYNKEIRQEPILGCSSCVRRIHVSDFRVFPWWCHRYYRLGLFKSDFEFILLNCYFLFVFQTQKHVHF